MNFLRTWAQGYSRTGFFLGLGVFVVITVLYVMMAYQQWSTGFVDSWDLGIFTQLAKSYAAFQAPITPIKGEGFNLLGDHFHPMLVLLGPIYALFPSAFTLLVVQAVLFGLASGIFSYACFKVFSLFIDQKIFIFSAPKRSSSSWGRDFRSALPYIASIGCGLAFGVSYGLESAAFVQFHEIAFGVPLVMLSLYYFVFHEYTKSMIWAALLVFVKEDLGLTVCVFGLVIAGRMWKENKNIKSTKDDQAGTTWISHNRWVFGIILAVWGVFWTWLSMKVLLPALNINSQYDYDKQSGVGTFLSDPLGTTVEVFSNDTKMVTLVMFLLVSAGTVFFSPISLLALPTLAWRFLSPEPSHWEIQWQYDAILMPIAFACLLDIVYKTIQRYKSKEKKSKKSRTATSQRYAHNNVCIEKLHTMRDKIRPWIVSYSVYWAPFIIILFGLITVFTLPATPVKNVFTPENYTVTANAQSVMEAADLVPENSTVETDINFINYLVDSSSRLHSGANPVNTLYLLDKPSSTPPDYAVLNTEHMGSGQIDNVAEFVMQSHQGTKYELIYNTNGVQVAKKIG